MGRVRRPPGPLGPALWPAAHTAPCPGVPPCVWCLAPAARRRWRVTGAAVFQHGRRSTNAVHQHGCPTPRNPGQGAAAEAGSRLGEPARGHGARGRENPPRRAPRGAAGPCHAPHGITPCPGPASARAPAAGPPARPLALRRRRGRRAEEGRAGPHATGCLRARNHRALPVPRIHRAHVPMSASGHPVPAGERTAADDGQPRPAPSPSRPPNPHRRRLHRAPRGAEPLVP